MSPKMTPSGPGFSRDDQNALACHRVRRYAHLEGCAAVPSLPAVVGGWAAKPTHSPQHAQRIGSFLTRVIEPYFSGRPVNEIRPEEIRAWMSWLSEERQLMASTVRTHFSLLRAALNWAVDQDLLVANPCKQVTPAEVPTSQRAAALTRMSAYRPQRSASVHHRAITPMVQLRRALFGTDTAADLAFILAQLRLGDDD